MNRLLLIALALAVPASAQTTILFEDFETDGAGSRYILSYDDTAGETGDYFRRSDGSDINVSYTGNDGFFFAGQDIDGITDVTTTTPGGQGAARQTIRFNGINITGYTSLTLSLDAAHEDGAQFDLADLVHASFVLDGTAPTSFETGYAIWFDSQPDGDNFNAPAFLNYDFDADGGDSPEDSEVLPRFATFTRTLGFNSTDATTVDLVITFDLNGGGEDFAIDNIALTGVTTASGDPTVTQQPDDVAGYRLLSVPVENYTVGDLAALNLVQGVTGQYPDAEDILFTAYTPASADPNDATYVAAGSTADVLEPGRGFFWYLFNNDVVPDPTLSGGGTSRSYTLSARPLTATGPVSETDVFVPVFSTSANGFYMIGNPFGQTFETDNLSWNGPGTLATTLQAYDPTTGYQPITIAAGTYLATWQGVFAEVQTAPAPPDSRRAGFNGFDFVYDAADAGNTSTFHGRRASTVLELALDGTLDSGLEVHDRAAWINFTEEGTPGWDRHDASKLVPPTSEFALIAPVGTRDGANYRQAVLSLGELSGRVEVPVDFRATMAGAFTITPKGLSALPSGYTATLVDRDMGTDQTLIDGQPVSFTAQAGDWDQRFTVIFAPASTAGESGPDGVEIGLVAPNPTSGVARLAVRVGGAEAVTATVFDALGREVAVAFDGVVTTEATIALPGDLAPGVYVVRVQGVTFGESRQFVVTR